MVHPHNQACPVAASLNQIGDMWTLMIVREAMNGATRFGEFQRGTGIVKTLLAARLERMVRDGLLARHEIGKRGVRHEYSLTPKGRALAPVMVAISQWGNDWIFGKGRAPLALVHCETGEPVAPLRPTTATGRAFAWREVRMIPGPGADAAMLARFTDRLRRRTEPTAKE